MKKLLSIILCLCLLFMFAACSDKEQDVKENETTVSDTDETVEVSPEKKAETEKFNSLADEAIENIEDDSDLGELKEKVATAKKDLETKVADSNEADKAQYDTEQIGIFMLEEAINEYETAKNEGDAEKIAAAKEKIELAKKIFASVIQ